MVNVILVDDDEMSCELLKKYINESERYKCVMVTTEVNGIVTQEPMRYDMYGFNSLDYDDNLMRAFMMNFNRYDNSKAFINTYFTVNCLDGKIVKKRR